VEPALHARTHFGGLPSFLDVANWFSRIRRVGARFENISRTAIPLCGKQIVFRSAIWELLGPEPQGADGAPTERDNSARARWGLVLAELNASVPEVNPLPLQGSDNVLARTRLNRQYDNRVERPGPRLCTLSQKDQFIGAMVDAQIEMDRRQYDELVDRYNQLVEKHNALLAVTRSFASQLAATQSDLARQRRINNVLTIYQLMPKYAPPQTINIQVTDCTRLPALCVH
jgi:hypothetical protein